MSFSGKRGRKADDCEEVAAPPPYVKTRLQSPPDTDSTGVETPLAAVLDRYLGPEYIATRAGPVGREVSYLKGSDVINLANKLFGHDNWSSEVLELTDKGVRQDGPKWLVFVTCKVRVTVHWPETGRETFHDGIGTGGAGKGAKTPEEALGMAHKTAATDALKRALIHFGKAMGNCCYDHDYLKWIETVRARTRKPDLSSVYAEGRLLRKPSAVESSGGSQQKLPFEPQRKNGAKVATPARLVPMKQEPEDAFDSDVFVDDDDEYTF
ncbi:rad52/22 family double-strand break repair protein domain-containing protein [Purpureocillium lilacinum]|uniref:Rad52/22 family double-strand break repair protein domain-containing protein n=1 Tax=Purpureocillium lilacinum TaxID=33203 RepID=A0A179EWI4_PURLI|nr:rad52/22 family double-strand break repair protein domain-containing protein [Purpureocillium lilacinum]OAQ57279.1 rad52/22 family double-strand break repair protein domain-containing protein [Purpureocillium lilacinum]